MPARSIFIATAACCTLALSTLPARAVQSADEADDLGEISASTAPAAGEEGDGKSIPEPVKVKPKFRFSVSARTEYTSNAILSGNHSSGDFLGLPTVEAGYNVALGKYFTLDLSAKVEAGLFADHSDRSFVGYSANATLDFRPFVSAPRIYISAEPYRYDSFDIGNSITQAIGLAAGTDYGYAFNNGRSLIYAGYNYEHYFADPAIDNRNSHRVVAGLAHQLRSNLTGQLFYAWQYNDFFQDSRHDSRHQVGANLIYTFAENWSGTFSTSFVDNDSNANRASYQSVNASLGLTLQF